jgi:hypothetical protein
LRRYKVIYDRGAEHDLSEILKYVAGASSREVATHLVERIISYCVDR